jgi:6-pyruvoyltetrahydropterin/6-carboxytetrahydropterin synthase
MPFYFWEMTFMYSLKSEASFDSAHFLSKFNGKCKNIHGHRWKIVVEIVSEELIADGKEKGMVSDFSNLKRDIGRLRIILITLLFMR